MHLISIYTYYIEGENFSLCPPGRMKVRFSEIKYRTGFSTSKWFQKEPFEEIRCEKGAKFFCQTPAR